MVELSESELAKLREGMESELTQLTRPDTRENEDDSQNSNKTPSQQRDNLSRHEMVEIIEKQRQEIKYLKQKLRLNEAEKEQIIENFQVSTSVLLDRLKDFEAERVTSSGYGERPQTATVLSKLSKCD